MRAALTGFEESPDVDDDPEPPECGGFFSGGLLVVPPPPPVDGFGRLLLGLAAVPEFAGFSFGLEVKNAPRTSSS
jgi:hypothetical protein